MFAGLSIKKGVSMVGVGLSDPNKNWGVWFFIIAVTAIFFVLILLYFFGTLDATFKWW